MKKFVKFVISALLFLTGMYLIGILVTGFFPSQVATCGQMLTATWYRIGKWGLLTETICGWITTAYTWMLGIFPHFGVMVSVSIPVILLGWAKKIRKEK
ncbi:MAG: hypothetical protein IKI57_05725 [Clostridia bacterium]|nr:hypothetical protein [Clostridia bacterium]